MKLKEYLKQERGENASFLFIIRVRKLVLHLQLTAVADGGCFYGYDI